MWARTMVAGWAILLGLWAQPAAAAFPGRDGALAVAPLTGPGLELVSPSGSAVTRVCTSAVLCGYPQDPRWSPNGRALVFVDGDSREVGIIAANGDCLWCLLGPPLSTLRGQRPAFTADGRQVSLIVTRHGDTGSVAQLSLTGGSPQRPSVAAASDAATSADGELALVRRGTVWVLPPAGGGHRPAARSLGPGAAPDFSPDGRELAIARGGWIWLVPALPSRHGRPRRLVPGRAPAFAPDGRRIAYVDPTGVVRLVGVRGGRTTSLGLTGRSVDWQPLPSRAPSCSVTGRRLIASNADAVFTTPASDPASSMQEVDGCLRALGLTRRLVVVTSDEESSSSLVFLGAAGRFALIRDFSGGKYDYCWTGVDRADTASGASVQVYGKYCDPFPADAADSFAVDSSGFTAWRLESPPPQSNPLTAISCWAPSSCVAVDAKGLAAVSQNPTGGRAAWTLSQVVSGYLSSVSCPAATLCVAAADGQVVTSSDPAGGAGSWSAVQVDPDQTPIGFVALLYVACPSITRCVGVDRSGGVLTTDDPTGGAAAWHLTHTTGASPNWFSAISCASSTFCAATTANGHVAVTTDPARGASSWTVGPIEAGPSVAAPNLTGISCPTTTLCVAVDDSGNVFTSTDPAAGAASWTRAAVGVNSLSAVSCPSSALCVAVSSSGRVVASTDPAGGAARWHASDADGQGALSAISCPSTSRCVAADSGGNVITTDDPVAGHWTAADIDVPNCAVAGAPCIVERVLARDDAGTRVLDTSGPGNGTQISGLGFTGADGLGLTWDDAGHPHQVGLG